MSRTVLELTNRSTLDTDRSTLVPVSAGGLLCFSIDAMLSPGVGMPKPADERDLLERLTKTMLDVGLLLQAAVELPGEAARLRITDALSLLEDAVQAARNHAFTESSPDAHAGVAESPLNEPGRSRWSAARRELLHERMLGTARGLQRSAAQAAALLEQQARIVQEPSPTDYRTEIKRWQAFADQAEQLACRLEQKPISDM